MLPSEYIRQNIRVTPYRIKTWRTTLIVTEWQNVAIAATRIQRVEMSP